MTSLEERFRKIRLNTGIQWHVLERDYLLSWILAGISKVPLLFDTLVFKGGTALRKCYFGDYRFSEDLDFTGLHGVPKGADMEHAVKEACDIAMHLLRKPDPIDITCERYVEKRPHPGNQETFKIRARLPWHKDPSSSIMVEITVNEKVLKPVQTREIIHQYSNEFLKAKIKTYSLEEIVAEKLRAILQNLDMLKRRGWARTRARDYYDLWSILSTYKDDMDFTEFISFLQNKCATRNVVFTGPEDFFDVEMLALVEADWNQSLEHLVPNLPDSESVIRELRAQITDLFA